MRQLYRLKSLSDYALCATDGEVGYVRQVFFDDRDWWIRYLVVHTGNWLMGRDVLVIPQMVASVDDERRRINVGLTREQIENSPPVS